ncbi:MAG: hypothetical protein ACRD08_15840, partial [Acidimicrobiales bacterium]
MMLCTRRALWLGAAMAALALAGVWVPGALTAMLVADAALLAAVWLDARLAPRVEVLVVGREAPPALSLGRGGEVAYA